MAGRVEARLVSPPLLDEDEFCWPIGTGPALESADSDDAGQFEFTDLPMGRLEIRAIASDGTTGHATVLVRLPGLRVQADVRIPSGPHTLSGRAVWSDGRPFRGLVAATGARDRRQPFDPGAVETEADGQFTITGLEGGLHRICTLSADRRFRTNDRLVPVPFDGSYEFVVDGELREWTGTVTAVDDGSPVGGARVTVTGYTNPYSSRFRSMARVQTDEQGRFRYRAPEGRVRVEVVAAGYLKTCEYDVEQGENLEIRLDRFAEFTGVVVSAEDGRPVAGVPIHHHVYAGSADGVTDAEGRFRVEEKHGGHRILYARGNGWISPELAISRRVSHGHSFTTSPLLLEVVPGELTELKLTVVRAVRVEGRVVDAAGYPIAGRLVTAYDAAPEPQTTYDEQRTATDPDGRFIFDSLIPGVAYHFYAGIPGPRTDRAGPFSGASGETLTVEVAVRTARYAALLVLDASSGEPVSGARIHASCEGGERLTDAAGRVRVGPLDERPLTVRAKHQDYQRAEQEIDEDSTADEIVIRMEPGLRLSGTVVFPDGTPAEDGNVLLRAAQGESAVAPLGFGGMFRGQGLHPGRYVLSAGVDRRGQHYRGAVTATVPSESVRIVLKEDGETLMEDCRSFTVRVVDSDGLVLPAVQVCLVSWKDPEELPAEGCQIPGRGIQEFEIPIEDEFVRAVAFDARSASGAPLPLGPGFVGPVAADRGELEIRLPPERVVTGRVVDPSGRGLPGLKVYAKAHGLEPQGVSDDQIIRSTFTSPDGTFRIGGLGDFEVGLTTATPPGLRRGEPRIARGGDKGVVLRLTRGLSATIRVLDSAGVPVAGAELSTSNWPQAITDQRGVARLEGLRPDRSFTLHATPPEERLDLCPVVLTDWTPTDTEVRLPTGWHIRGVVVDSKGRPIKGAIVRGEGSDEEGIEVATGRNGEFEIGPVPAEGMELFARPPLSRETFWREGAIPVEAGASNVKFVLGPYGDLEIHIEGWSKERWCVDAYLTAEDDAGDTIWYWLYEERILFSGVPTDRAYTLYIEPDEEGRIVYARHLRAGSEPVVVRLEEGGTISGTIVFPAGGKSATVEAEGRDFLIRVDAKEDGTFVIPGVPPGECRVTVWATGPDRSYRKAIDATAGDKLRFSFD